MQTTNFLLIALSISQGNAFLTTPSTRSSFISSHTTFRPETNTIKSINVITTKLHESKIPADFRREIYEAEAKTPAAQGRQTRTIGYGISAFFFLALGLANVVLTSMQIAGQNLDDMGYGFLGSDFFLTSTKVGGYVDIIGAGLLGTMVELENRTREETAEKIWEELQRRKAENDKASTRRERRKRSVSTSKGGKKSSVKKSKRLAALAEVIVEDEKESPLPTETVEVSSDTPTKETKENEPVEEEGGIMGSLKKFYKQADTLAASQALLLNKELEDKGLVDKITDETGLKVIGKEAAANAKEETKKQEKEETK